EVARREPGLAGLAVEPELLHQRAGAAVEDGHLAGHGLVYPDLLGTVRVDVTRREEAVGAEDLADADDFRAELVVGVDRFDHEEAVVPYDDVVVAVAVH